MECFNADDDQYEQYEDTSVIHATGTVRTSSLLLPTHFYQPGTPVETERLEADELKQHGIFATVYPNGTSGNPGCVSISFIVCKTSTYFDGICIVSLIDSSNCHRFSQTFTIPYPQVTVFTIDEFISRKQLLSDPDDLLPNGELTLMIHVRLTLYPEISRYAADKSNFGFDESSRRQELLLNSLLTKNLSEDSTYFRAISDTTMNENRTKIMPIQAKEEAAFQNVDLLTLGINVVIFGSFKEIFDLYILADKYDTPLVRDTCTCFWKLYASAHNTDELFKCINRYKDKCVKELLEKQIMSIRDENFAEEIVKTDECVSLKQPVHNYLWTYGYSHKYDYLKFINVNKATKYSSRKKENDEYDFYK